MPFTFSHPAIVLPLAYLPRKWFSMTGLVIGSLAPDFEYFIRMEVQSHYSHTLDGLFWFDIPLGLSLAFVFHNIVRDSLLSNLPTFLKSRFSLLNGFKWNNYFRKNWLVVIISILIGAASHIFWDSFTHLHGYFTQIFPILTNTVELFGIQIPFFKILQHSSTLIGGLIIALVIFNLPTVKLKQTTTSLKYWLTVIALTLTTISIRFATGLHIEQYGSVIATIISATFLSLILTPVILKKLGK